MLEIDWFARTYGWTPAEIRAQERRIMVDLCTLRGYRAELRKRDG